MRKWKKWVAGMMSFAMISSMGNVLFWNGMSEVQADNCGGLLEEDLYTPEPYEVIQDPVLHWAVRSAMNAVKSGVKLTEKMVGDPSVQYISYELCNHPEDFEGWEQPYWIESLEGLQYAKSAKMIDIGYTSNIKGKKIDSVEPLAPLTQLQTLYLKQDGITDISPLGSLVNLEQLDVSGNYEIADITAVKDMSKLQTLDFSINSVSDLTPAAGLGSLQRLNASDNQIASLPDMSAMASLTALDLSKNQLTDVSALAVLSRLEELNLSGNDGLTDVKALAGLVNLKKDSTYMPTEKMKEDLFAAINVNKLFLKFNISHMTKDDLTAVEEALEAYQKLTEDQKSYIDAGKAEAAESNKALVEAGQDPVYYPEYDQGGEPVPVFDRVTIRVVDQNGEPLSGVEFTRKDREYGYSDTAVTDENGKLTFVHSTLDYWGKFEVYPSGDLYVAEPEQITYSVGAGNTEEINGAPATGLEDLVIKLTPVDQYVDKAALETALQECGTVKEEESYKYTEESWSAYQQALAEAQRVYGDGNASREDVSQAEANLRNAFTGLTKADVLTKIKITVKDENGNLFLRPFKFQVRETKNHDSAWNIESDGKTGVVYLPCSPAWTDGQEWEILACDEEPYEFTSIVTVIGVKDDTTYFKTVDGEEQGPDFETEITVKPEEKSTATREPDSTVLEGLVEDAAAYTEDGYTPATWKEFADALESAKEVIKKDKASQEEYNQAGADLRKAEAGLLAKADKSALKEELDDDAYSEHLWTTDSWKAYEDARENAQKVYEDENATQQQVDEARTTLAEAKAGLVARADKTALENKLNEAAGLDESSYTDGWEELQAALKEAQEVFDDPDATQDEVDEQIGKIDAAIQGLVEKPAEVPDYCEQYAFRAVVQDQDGNRLSGITFDILRNGEKAETATSSNGVVSYSLYSVDYQAELTVSLQEGQGYVTNDVHKFTAGAGSQFIPLIDTINGQPYQSGTRLVFTLAEEGQELPDIDVQKLEEKIKEAQAVTADGYTEESFARLQEAIEDAQAVLEDPKSQAEVNEQIAKLDEALKGLEESQDPAEPDKSVLEAWISSAETYPESSYTEDSYAVLAQAVADAKAVLDDPEADQAAIEKACKAIEDAIAQLVAVDQPVYCEKTYIRIKVVYENGGRVPNGILFTMDRGGYGTYNSYTYDGVVGYALSTADAGMESMTVSLKDGQTVIGGKTYTADPQQFTFTFNDTNPGVEIAAIDGQPFTGQEQLVFTLRPVEDGNVDKTALNQLIETAEGLVEQDDIYTLNSLEALETALEAAKAAAEDPDAGQEQVDQAKDALQAAVDGLKEIQGMQTLKLPVKMQDGSNVPISTEFVRRDMKYSVNNRIFTDEEGNISWTPTRYDSGDYLFFLPESSPYIATPEQIMVHVGSEDGTAVIETIDGIPAAEWSGNFTLSDLGTDTCDLTHFRAVVQDKDGNPLPGVKFDVKNGDPDELVSNENGVITYEATIWDTDTTMTVSLQDGQGWVCKDQAEFSVIVDPNDPERAILGTVNGEPAKGGEKIIFQLRAEGDVELPYTDVTEDDWHYEAVKYAFEKGIMTGINDTTFAPNENLARAQFAVILHRMNGTPAVEYTDRFHDVAEGVWYTDAILWAADKEVVTGYSNGNFGPADHINREQMALMMYRYAKSQGYSLDGAADFSQYQDASYVSDFAQEAMAWTVGNGIITGKYNETQLDPQGNATRAECATIMMRFLEKFAS